MVVNVNKFQVRPYTYKELTEVYGISRKTLMSWLRPHKERIGTKTGRYFTVKQVDIIFQHIGFPSSISDDPKEY